MKFMVQRLLIFILALQLSFGAALSSLYANPNTPENSEEIILGDSYKQVPWPLSILSELHEASRTPEVQKRFEALETGLTLIEEGRTDELPKNATDVFHLSGQRFEILKKGKVTSTYPLDQLNIELPYIAYFELKVHIEGKDLVISAFNAGEEVARHIIPNLNPAAFASDRELLYVVDQTGRIHVTDMAFVKTQALFRAPIPWFKSLWTPSPPLNVRGEFKLSFLKRDVEPFAELDPNHPRHHEVVLPRELNPEKKIIFSEGDLIFYTQLGNQRNLIGIFSRSITHMQIARASIVLAWLGFLANPSETPPKIVKSILELIQLKNLNTDIDLVQRETLKDLPILGSFSPRAIEALVTLPHPDIEDKRLHGNQNEELAQRKTHRLLLEDWIENFKRLQDESQTNTQTPSNALEETPGKIRQTFSFLGKYLPGPKTLTLLGAIAGATTLARVGYTAEIAPIVNSVNYVLEHWLPQDHVFNNFAYCFPALVVHSIALLAVIPILDMVGDLSVPAIKQLSTVLQKIPGERARKLSTQLNEWAQRWQPLNTWQRNVSLGMRPYAAMMLPFYHWFCNKILRQPNFLASLRAGLNPFSKNPDAPTAGRIGINIPTVPFVENTEVKNKRSALSALAEKRQSSERLAHLLAFSVVIGKPNMDPTNITPEDVQKVLHNPHQYRQWQLTTKAILKYLKNLSPDECQNLANHPSNHKKMSEAFETFKNYVAQNIVSEGFVPTILKYIPFKSKRLIQKTFKALAQFGIQDFELLIRSRATEGIAEQVEMEFKEDHIFMVIYPSIHGITANLKHPQRLVANPNSPQTLYINPVQAYRMAINTIAHYFFSGSRLMLVYFKKPPVLETTYNPESPKIAEISENLFQSAFEWFKGLLNFKKSDLGGVFKRSFIRQATTIQAGLLLSIVFRLWLTDQSLEEAIRGWWLNVTAGVIYIGTIWYLVQAGNHVDRSRISKKLAEFQKHLIATQESLRLHDPEAFEVAKKNLVAFYKSHARNTGLENMNSDELLKYVAENPPFATQGNKTIRKLSTWAAVFISTYFGVKLTVFSLEPEYLTNAMLLKWTGFWLAFNGLMWLSTSHTSWEYLTSTRTWHLLSQKVRKASNWLKITLRIGKCEDILDAP